ncbi:UDP-2,3-diacylglucosamine diphosphatase [Desulfuromonas thiophila]|uniref:UDP-2,3-diacylglucosamine hydrolase n=1 Tax=Desulfuromonas thiophila TaxID=57664 RepID=A0A1G7DSP7_9BACT|nr:UDP-2,3-diacylglucosamine diphosphatase [Desulfuromonas thiophila]SDE54190.1 UDP-2,3-diacylglucosamine hydrolase [Desulfuromonas thiophila]
MSRTLILADAHLKQPTDPAYRDLLQFLQQQQQSDRPDCLILLGDLFEFWIGYRHCVFSAYLPLLQQLWLLQQSGTRLIVAEGNHDFHLGPYFSQTLGATLIADSATIALYGHRLWLTHGDRIGASHSYRLWRWLLRSRASRLLQQLLPADAVWALAERLSALSRRHSRPRPGLPLPAPPRPALQQAGQVAAAAGCDLLLCGHFHQPWRLSADTIEVVVVGDWAEKRCYAELDAGGLRLCRYGEATGASDSNVSTAT